MTKSYLEILTTYWGYQNFRPLQEQIIESIGSGKDTLAILPTGGGKSICFQVPSLAKPGVCVVVSPLIALIQDQVSALRAKNIRATMVVSGMSSKQIDHAYGNSIFGDYKFLYVSPERLQNDTFLTRFQEMPVNFLAVDEAHCISQWGFDFRPSYLNISELREIKNVPIIALTATATKEVEEDIVTHLALEDEQRFKGSIGRDNLSFQVREEPDKLPKLRKILSSVPGQSIVYTSSRKATTLIAQELENQNFSATNYHAGLSQENRDLHQHNWVSGQDRIIVATNAFGMGIDKADVRSVIHYQMPESIEAYYQEAGRAGRDGKNAFAILLYNQQDEERLLESKEERFPGTDVLKNVLNGLFLYLKINFGDGMGKTYPFNLYKFAHHYNLSTTLVYNSIQALVRQAWLVVSQPFYNPTKFQFSISNRELYKFQVDYPDFEPLVKFILRNYGGVFDQLTRINEDEIAKNTGLEVDVVNEQLTYLGKTGIAKYYPQSEEPLMTFLKERPKGDEYIQFDQEQLNFLRSRHQDRIDALLNYAHNPYNECRTRILQQYFNEEHSIDCGICDVCLRKKASAQQVDYQTISKDVLTLLKSKEQTEQELKLELKQPSTVIKKVLQFLEQEHLIKREQSIWQINE